ncbi:ATP-dependent DNA helicase Q1-like [Montipora foliosa]|uniref:ATP-dependent DNA helicase Q1-like n=1 Tax=Montipora foliosa TaxID=591990 RepID=UPI0035F1CE05
MFFSNLQRAISESSYWNVNLKPKQVKCLEAIYLGRVVVAVLPTGYGKSIIFHLLPVLLFGKVNSAPFQSCGTIHPIVIVVSPLNALIQDQIRRSNQGSIKAAILNVKKKENSDDVELDLADSNSSLLREGRYELVFTHPEAVLSCKEGLELLRSSPYQRSVQAIVIDEAHCILEWGDDFRKDYSHLGMLCAIFPNVPVVALTATASKTDISTIKKSLTLRNPLEVIGNPNRPNIYYKKVFREGEDVDFFEELLAPIAHDLKVKTVNYPITIMYLPLRWCGFAFKFFEKRLGNKQYYPSNAKQSPENRLFAQYHAPQTSTMKDQILKELSSSVSKVRVVFATVAMGMGVDIPSIRTVIHVGPPRTVREYFQETGRAGRDGKQAHALLYYNNRDIATNRTGMSDDVRSFCQLEDGCLRKFLLNCLDARVPDRKGPSRYCCSYCESTCKCLDCIA